MRDRQRARAQELRDRTAARRMELRERIREQVENLE